MQASHAEVMASIFTIQSRAATYLEAAAHRDIDGFTHVCQSTYRSTMLSENTCTNWCRVRGARGLYVVCASGSRPMDVSDGGLPFVESGSYMVELDLSGLELRVAGTCPKGLEQDIADDEDVVFLLGAKAKVFLALNVLAVGCLCL